MPDITVDTTAIAIAEAKLTKSATRSSLEDFVASKTKRSLILVDCSDSMNAQAAHGEGLTRIDQLRIVVDNLRKTRPAPVAAFGHNGWDVEVVDTIPPARGSTPLHLAIDFGTAQGANHLVVVTDGEPDSPPAAYESATRFGGQIDVAFCGDPTGDGAKFAMRLARMTGGQCDIDDGVDFSKPKELTAKLAGYLGAGDGTDTL